MGIFTSSKPEVVTIEQLRSLQLDLQRAQDNVTYTEERIATLTEALPTLRIEAARLVGELAVKTKHFKEQP